LDFFGARMFINFFLRKSLFPSLILVGFLLPETGSNPAAQHRTVNVKQEQSAGSENTIKQLAHFEKTRVTVNNAVDTYNCNSDYSKCEKITYFNVDDDQTNSCYQERLTIHFDTAILHPHGHKQAVAGFLKPFGFDNSIEKSQRKNKLCQLIKRCA
jgi:hypothetical protein